MKTEDIMIHRLIARFDDVIAEEDASNEEAGIALLLLGLMRMMEDGYNERGAVKYLRDCWKRLEVANVRQYDA